MRYAIDPTPTAPAKDQHHWLADPAQLQAGDKIPIVMTKLVQAMIRYVCRAERGDQFRVVASDHGNISQQQ